jgi:predicted alpha/beta-fold hydrolase
VSVAPVRAPCGEAGLPPYDFDIEDGLYATITANSCDAPKVEDETKVKLAPEGFRKDIEARVVWQAEPRPLAVLLLGLATRGKDKMAQLWKGYLHDAGFSVLTFDSPFLPAFSERSRHGVAANLVEEAKLVANLVDAFLKAPATQGRVTRLGFVGISYGGSLALNLARMAQEGRVPVRPERVLAFSPPVKLKTAARLLDKFYAEDRWSYTLADLAGDLLDHKPVPKGTPIPFTASEMRAGIAATFRIDMKDVLDFDDRFYKLGVLPKRGLYDAEYRRDVAGAWTFTKFVEEACYPHWAERTHLGSVEDLWAAGDLLRLLPACPDTVHVVEARDDPLNDPAELEALERVASPARLTVLPHGGHLGYNRTAWLKARVAKLFE